MKLEPLMAMKASLGQPAGVVGSVPLGQRSIKLVFNDALLNAFATGHGMEIGDTYFMTQPRFETGHADYAWLNSVVAVAEGHVTPGGVEYQVYECRHG